MTKFSKDQFIEKFKKANGHHLELLTDDYFGVDSRYKVKCSHSIHNLYGWSIIKPKKYCCKKGYWESKKKSDAQATDEFIAKSKKLWPENTFDYSKCRSKADAATKGHKVKLKCIEHNIWFEQHVGSHLSRRLGCSRCKSRQQSEITKQHHNQGILGGKSQRSISKGETKWLNELGVPERQHKLVDVEYYSVDGYDPNTNTVYLYHGRFWHGCPETYDPEYVHPIVGLKMKELYEATCRWEQKIQNAGYNLVIKWGD